MNVLMQQQNTIARSDQKTLTSATFCHFMQHSTGPKISSVAMRMSSLTSPNNVGSMKSPSSPFRLPMQQILLGQLYYVDMVLDLL